MAEPVSPDRTWKGTRPSVVMLVMIALTTLLMGVPAYVVGKHSEDGRSFLKNYRHSWIGELRLEASMDYALHSTEANDVVFVGGSTCGMAVHTKLFEQETGLRAYNLGGQGYVALEGFVLVLQRYLEHHPAPKVIVLCIHPREFQPCFTEEAQLAVRERFIWAYGPGTEATRPRHACALLDYTREGIRFVYGQATGGVKHYRNAEEVYGKRPDDWLKDIAMQRGFHEVREPLRDQPPLASENHFILAPTEKAQLAALACLTREKGIGLVIRSTPVMAGTAPDHAEELEASLQEYAGQWPHVMVGAPQVVLYDASCFMDQIHTIRKGADEFTALLAGEVAAALAKRQASKTEAGMR